MQSLDLITQLIKTLTEEDRKTLIQQLEMGGTVDELMNSARMEQEHACVKCGCTNIVKYGKAECRQTKINKATGKKETRKTGYHQRYKCKDCGCTFTSTCKSVFYRSKLSSIQLGQVIKHMVNQDSIKFTAENAHSTKKTIFRWRHKILDSLAKENEQIVLKGIVESDETDFNLSFKGNPSNYFAYYGKCFKERRKYLQDHPNETPRGHLGKVSVCCGIDRDYQAISLATNLGKSTYKDIGKLLDNRIDQNSILCSDKNAAYVKYAKLHNIGLIQVESNDRIARSGEFSVQGINNYHSNLEKWFKFFRGVATKYLNNYLMWYNFVWYMKKLGGFKEMKGHLANTVFYETLETVPNRPSIPFKKNSFDGCSNNYIRKCK